MHRIALVLIIAALGITPSAAEIYKWVDRQGNVHFGDKPPQNQDAQPVTVKPNTYESVAVEPFEAFQGSNKAQANSVVMYSASWCGVCKQARAYFQANKIPFTEYDVETTARGKKDYADLKGRGVPIVLVGKQRMNGFSPGHFEALYAKR